MAQPLLAVEDVRYYDIELVVFENLEENTENNELWPRGKQLLIPDNAAHLGQDYAGTLPPEFDPSLLFKLLESENYKLTEEVETLRESEKYRVLMHIGWRQPGLDRNIAIPVHFMHSIADEQQQAEVTENEVTVQPPTPTDEATQSPITTPAIPGVDQELPQNETTAEVESTETATQYQAKLAHLQGNITVVLSRYLHLDIEMLYKKQADDTRVDMFDSSFLEEQNTLEPVYYLKQNRRMRSKETHYIDHPKFSMLVHITPFIPEKPEPAVPAPGQEPGKTPS